ncbi:MAG: phosphate acyltransferase PlsX [Armatimonadetes bacterium]|nr:phosphate acyltransferase PlsX [Armatimonadota bacterium]
MASARTCIAVDVMGGDLGPAEIVRGCVAAARDLEGSAELIIVGDERAIEAELGKVRDRPPGIRVRHASQVIEMCDRPSEVYRRKRDASVAVAARLVKEGEAKAFISIGNTGAAMAASVYMLRPIEGIDRPAIATPLPSLTGHCVLLDAGANVDCLPRQLVDFAIMGLSYARLVQGKPNPTVGLLSNGEESSKGNALTREAHALLKQYVPQFVGNIEGRDVFTGRTDVIVCDGFDGNIVLKTAEGSISMVLNIIKQDIMKHAWMKLLLLPLRNELRRLTARMDYRHFGGAPLLGVNGLCIVGHGRSDADAVRNAIRVACASVDAGLVADIARSAAALHTAMPPAGAGRE